MPITVRCPELSDLQLVNAIEWLLRDDFTDVLAAGSVDDTYATPGPGVRDVVTDTDNKLSIGSGVANFAPNSVPADGDPGLWYKSMEREAGRLLVTEINVTGTATFNNLGWDVNQSGGIQDSFDFSAGNLFIRDNAVILAVATYSGSTNYQLAIVQRTVGYYFFIKEGAFTNWSLLWAGVNSSTDPLYPGIHNFNTNFTNSFMRVPLETFLPTPLAYDTFTRANGALGSSEIVGPDNQIVIARTWTNQIGTTLIASNAISASALSGGVAIATVDVGNKDGLIDLDLTRGTTSPGVIFRYVDVDNYIFARHNGTNAQLIKRIAGVETTLVDIAATYGAGNTLRCIYYTDGEDLKIRLYYNNVLIGTEQTVSDAIVHSSSLVGSIFDDTDSTGDNFQQFARGQNDASYDRLNNFIIDY